MFKKTMLLMAASMVVVLAFGAQQAAAHWYYKSQKIGPGENPKVVLSGALWFTGPVGTVHCTSTTLNIELTGGTTDGHIQSFSIAPCTADGDLFFWCGGSSISGASVDGTPTATAEGDAIRISNLTFTFQCQMTGVKLSYSTTGSGLTATPDDPSAIETLTVEEKMDSLFKGFPNQGTLASTLTISGEDKGKYGVTP